MKEQMTEDIVSSPDFSDNEGKEEASLYSIQKLHDTDSEGLVAAWKRKIYKLSPFSTMVSILSSLAFYSYRIFCIVEAQRIYHKPYIVAWVFVFTEACLLYPQLLQQLFQVLSIRSRRREKLRLIGNNVPTVDILVVVCNEDIDVILDTVRSACLLDYPADRFRIAVCDDGKDAKLKEAVENLSKIYPNLYYNARVVPKGTPHNFKAGNLRAGTEFMANLKGGPAEYLAGLDADMIASPDWLRASLPHMVHDPKVALACPPQLFYNIPRCDPLTQSTLSFSHVNEQTKDANGVAWHTGSGYVLRLEALKHIGGWPIASLNEDTLTSTLLLGHGWKTAYIHESLQIGLIPDTLIGHLKQRMRWSLGNLQTAKHLKCCLYGPLTAHMKPIARISSWLIILDTCSKIFLTIAMLAIPSVLWSGGTLVAYGTETQLRWLLRLSFIGFCTSKLNDAITFLPSGYRLAQRESAAQLWMSIFYVRTHLRSFVLPTWLGGRPLGFDSSGSVDSGLNERDASKRAPLMRRMKVMIWDCGLSFHALYIPFMVGALVLSFVRGARLDATRDEKLLYLLTHAFWPPLVWLNCLTACVEVIRYVIWPSDMVDREELLTRDANGAVTLSTKYGRGEYVGLWGWWYEIRDITIGSYLAALFVGSFII